MSWTKRQFIEAALEEIGIASYAFDSQPEELESALRRLDSMVAEWGTRGIRLGFPLSDNTANSNIDDQTSVPTSSREAIILNLALRLAPSYGRQVSQDTRNLAKNAYTSLLMRSGTIQEKQFPETLPRGAGNKPHRYETDQFFPTPTEDVDVSPAGELELY